MSQANPPPPKRRSDVFRSKIDLRVVPKEPYSRTVRDSFTQLFCHKRIVVKPLTFLPHIGIQDL